MKSENLYPTSDLALASFISLYVPIESIERTDDSRVVFLFKITRDLLALVESYHRKEQKIEPQTYFQQIRIVKSRIYEK